ncbi:MAG: hypothetical protein AB1547_09010 [Thermodesulfobacteriota bacterium]
MFDDWNTEVFKGQLACPPTRKQGKNTMPGKQSPSLLQSEKSDPDLNGHIYGGCNALSTIRSNSCKLSVLNALRNNAFNISAKAAGFHEDAGL